MRILQISNLYPPYWIGGYEQIAEWVARGLRERGHVVDVLTGRGEAFEGRAEIHGDLDLDLAAVTEMSTREGIRFPTGLSDGLRRHVFSRANLQAALRAIDRLSPDLVSFWNPAFISFTPLLAARRRRIPAVVHLSDLAANVFRNPHPPAFPRPFRALARSAVDLLLRWARPVRFIVPSAFLKERLSLEGIPRERTEVLHWPVERAVGSAATPLRDGAVSRLLFVGALIPEKGPGVLIEALKQAIRSRPDLSLTLVGEGPAPYVSVLRRAAVGLPVRFTGRLDRSAVIDAYSSHDVLVFPSTWEEPYAVVPLEAMSMGLAVIATRTGGTPEAVGDGDTGLLVPSEDPRAITEAIVRLAADPVFARALASRGLAWARGSQGFDRFMDRLTALYGKATPAAKRAA